jgi:hypothetical protein
VRVDEGSEETGSAGSLADAMYRVLPEAFLDSSCSSQPEQHEIGLPQRARLEKLSDHSPLPQVKQGSSACVNAVPARRTPKVMARDNGTNGPNLKVSVLSEPVNLHTKPRASWIQRLGGSCDPQDVVAFSAGIGSASDYFVGLADSTDLNLFKFHVEFANPANSTLAGPTLVPVAPFSEICARATTVACMRSRECPAV